MRNEMRRLWLERTRDPRFVLLTGDLGFSFLEEMRDRLGERFLNAGIAEQNMISVAAGLARAGMKPWTYTIGPFCYARAFEQLRLSVGIGGQTLRLVANGAGFAYGPQGAEHHAADDLAVLQTIANLDIYLPAGAEDLEPLLARMDDGPRSSYLRLSRESVPGFRLPPWQPLRHALPGRRGLLVSEGAVGKWHVHHWSTRPPEERPSIWLVGQLPLPELPSAFLHEIESAARLTVVEEHIEHGGVGAHLIARLLRAGIRPPAFEWRGIREFPSPVSGSREFLWREQGLTP